ncbi:MAG: heavy metal-associated domain-containing protein [Fuerstiella sp.]
MKSAIALLPLVLLLGCSEERIVTADGDASAPVASNDAIPVSFAAGDTATLAVPEMSCAMMCFPKVKETLEGIEGVTVVELVPQKEDGIIDDRRVTVKFDAEASSDKAIAALESAGFPDSKFE